MRLPELPIQEVLPALRQALVQGNRAVLTAPPGSGKSTLIPLFLLDEPWLAGRSILMLEPRRLATRLCATRMAELLGESLGQRVGYRIRQESRLSATTRIEVVTEGILTRRLQTDPELNGVGLVIFDEFHERSIHADLALALCLDAAQALRPDLRLLLMSATLEAEALSTFLGSVPLIRGEGRQYPVQIHYLERDSDAPALELAERCVRRALAEQPGDVLVFLPGTGEIRRLEQRLRELLPEGVAVWPLYADLEREAQQHALQPDPNGQRRVVLATSVAETSLTIEGIHTVVDLGLARRPQFEPNSGLSRLLTLPCSRHAAEQRAGRAGRLAPGVCYRLWSESSHQQREQATQPEILAADLAPLLLETARWGVSDPNTLSWLDPPPTGAMAQARSLLQALDLLDEPGRITALGQRASELGLHPRLAHLLLTGEAAGQGLLAADLAALLSERDILRGPQRPADLELRLRLLRHWRQQGRAEQGVDAVACRQVARLSDQLCRMLQQKGTAEGDAGALLLAAYPDRLAGGSEGDPLRFKLASGRAARLPEGDALLGSSWLVVAELDAGQREGRIYLAAPVALEAAERVLDLHLVRGQEVVWQGDRLQARQVVRYGELLLRQSPDTSCDPELIRTALIAAIRQRGLGCLSWSDEAEQLRSRLRCLRSWQPNGGWPDLDDAHLLAKLEGWLGPWLQGFNRLEQLRGLDLSSILLGPIDWQTRQRLEREAPTHLTVPSGSRKRLEYRVGEPPVLAVKLQEMFGLHDTPTVCSGQVAVMLHLLSPAQRPVQVTQDLRGFWQRTYQEVKKELKGRYPKHYWPDDPFSAVATARVRPATD